MASWNGTEGTKGEKRELKARKAHNGAYQGVRTSTLRAGVGLVNKVVKATTKMSKGGKVNFT